jgi:hypothetical protein
MSSEIWKKAWGKSRETYQGNSGDVTSELAHWAYRILQQLGIDVTALPAAAMRDKICVFASSPKLNDLR